jgi:hypothetical protein
MQTKDVLGTRYRLDQRIAVGGMGDVWAARDELLGRPVALKLLHPNLAADDGFRARFRAEAKASARLSHPGIVSVYDYGEDTDAAYLAMELVDGQPLSTVLGRRGKLTPTETMSLVAQAAEALAAAHAEGLVHRDVKPANLLLRPDGRVKVTDFGIVRAADTSTITHDGSVLGTVAYMSPEQVRGQKATAASDLYSLGVVAYECLSGSRPYMAGESIAVALAHLHDPVPPLPTEVPNGVQQLVLRMLSKDPADRPDSAAAVADTARRLSADGDATWALGALRGVAGSDVEARDSNGAGWSSFDVGGPPTEETTAGLSGREHREAMALAGLAEHQTIALPPPRPVMYRPATPRRQWTRVAGAVAGALLIALVFAAASSGGGSPTGATIAVPQLRGVPLGAAEHRLSELGLHFSTGHPNLAPTDIVVGERPGAGTAVARGTTVLLTVRAPVAQHPAAPTTTTAPHAAAPQPPPPPPGQTGGTAGPGHGHGKGNH